MKTSTQTASSEPASDSLKVRFNPNTAQQAQALKTGQETKTAVMPASSGLQAKKTVQFKESNEPAQAKMSADRHRGIGPDHGSRIHGCCVGVIIENPGYRTEERHNEREFKRENRPGWWEAHGECNRIVLREHRRNSIRRS